MTLARANRSTRTFMADSVSSRTTSLLALLAVAVAAACSSQPAPKPEPAPIAAPAAATPAANTDAPDAVSPYDALPAEVRGLIDQPLTGDLDTLVARQQPSQPLARGLLVVGHEHAYRRHVRTSCCEGMVMVTSSPPSGRR